MMNESGKAFAVRISGVVDNYQVQSSNIVNTGTVRLPTGASVPYNAALHGLFTFALRNSPRGYLGTHDPLTQRRSRRCQSCPTLRIYSPTAD